MKIDVSQLRGNYVYLEALAPSHIPELKVLAKDERIWEYTKSILVDEAYEQRFEKYIEAALDPRYTGGQFSFVIRAVANDTLVGMTRYYKVDAAHKRLSVGFTWYIPEVWGQVHNKECKLLLVQYAIEVLGFQRVEFEVAHQNIRSQKAVEKIGGVKEALLRKHGLHADGTMRHTYVYSIIDDEWPQTKSRLKALIAENEVFEKKSV